MKLIFLFIALTLFMLAPSDSQSQVLNEFDLSESLVPTDEILRGGPPRDGIPSIDEPDFISATEANWLRDDDRVLGISRNGKTKAYPIRIMDWHEIVNDTFGDEAIAVTWCPLCGSGMAFKSDVDGMILELGVSGLLYNSDVLMYDRQTESLWSQIGTKAITGHFRGQRLETVPMYHTSWKDWNQRHPDTKVLSRETGFNRNYERQPYKDYEGQERLYFPVRDTDDRFDLKEWVVGITIGETSKVYAFSELEKAAQPLKDEIEGQKVTIDFDSDNRSAAVYTADGEKIPSLTSFWFAWYAFHPDTEVFTAD